jgi:hypothetical protein
MLMLDVVIMLDVMLILNGMVVFAREAVTAAAMSILDVVAVSLTGSAMTGVARATMGAVKRIVLRFVRT